LEPAQLSAACRYLFGLPWSFRSVSRREMDHRGAVHAPGRQDTERASGLGRADLQRDRGARESRPSILDAAAARHPRPQGTRHRGLLGASVRHPRADGSLSRVDSELHASLTLVVFGTAMKPRVLITREIPIEAINRLKEHFVVESNQKDLPVSP